jgi:lipoprotein-releasing system permease protein
MILIFERTNMIGIMKSLGARNWGIRRIFLYYAAYIILNGLFWGNLLGIGLCLLQKYFKFIRLDEENYYLSYAPIHFNLWSILLLNVGTLVITLLFLVIPSYLVSRISPVKAIRFD